MTRNQPGWDRRAGQQDQFEDAHWRLVRGPNFAACACLFGIGVLCFVHHTLMPLWVMLLSMLAIGVIGGLLHWLSR